MLVRTTSLKVFKSAENSNKQPIRIMRLLLSLLGLLILPAVSQGQSFVATLDGAQDGGGTRAGSGIFNLTLSGTTMTLSGSFSGISGTFSDAHIHGSAAPGANAGVLYSIVPFLTLGADNKSGTLSGQITMVPMPNNRDVPITQQLLDLNNGLWYFNIHSSSFGGGEIRGQILSVPEPSTLALIGLGLGGLLVQRSRRRFR
jgi:hypothetical protein